MPPEFRGAQEEYVDFVILEVLPEAARLAEAADVFLERGSGGEKIPGGLRPPRAHPEDARRSVLRARCAPAGHRARRPQRGPSGSPPPARTLVEEGAIVVLASDFNPGSSFCESLPLVMNLACTRLKLSPAEALSACTANAAHALGLEDVGRLAPGYRADVLVLDAPDWRYLAYHLGGDRFAARIKSGLLL